jgi:hypothetical protein
MKEEFDFVKQKFNDNLKKYKKHYNVFEKIDNYEINWSHSYIDFFPYESAMDGFKPAILYKNKPKPNKDSSIIENRIKANEIYYSYNESHKEWGSEFYFTDEQNNKIRMYYENQNEEEKMLLSQLYYKIMDGKIVKKVYCYMHDPDMDEETFYIFEYYYEEENLKKIIRLDYFDKGSEIVFEKKKLDHKK